MPLGVGKATKRKAHAAVPVSRKKARVQHRTADDLPWKVVAHRHEAGFDNALEGMMELEEVTGVEVVYEDTGNGRVARFQVVESDEEPLASENGESKSTQPTAGPSHEGQGAEVVEEVEEEPVDLPEWKAFELHRRLERALQAQGFATPTPIQSKALPAAIKGRDVIGVAETGSGKTLAYGLPILHRLLSDAHDRRKRGDTKQERKLRALILAPTRELALQVTSHLNICLTADPTTAFAVKEEEVELTGILDRPESKKGKNKNKKGKEAQAKPTAPRKRSDVSVAAIVGGMSAQKQRRVIDRGVDVLVATPGRLWDIMQEDDRLASQIKTLKFLVLDEADRMIETGHFAELDNILRLTLRESSEEAIEPDHGAESAGEPSKPPTSEVLATKDDLQTFVFSATLSKDLQRNLKRRLRPKSKKSKKQDSTLDDLLLRLDFRDPDPEIIDLSPAGGVVSTLTESRVNCLAGAKDAYLYYFLLRYPGRSLVFLSSIDGIRRLMPMLELLEVKAFPLHSQLEQRQRLKNLDRFKTTPNSVLLATDIAARGLDIPSVDHVIHFQVPRSADVYVHRNGRTARAKRSGFSLLMCAPEERRVARALLNSVGRQEDDIPEMTVELYMLDKLKARIQLARQVDLAQHKVKKENHEKKWLREAAEAMEIEIDSDMNLSDDDNNDTRDRDLPSKKQRKVTSAKTAALKAELKELLAQPLIARGVSTRYITSGSRSIVDDMVLGQHHETMLGLTKSAAGSDAVPTKRKKPSKAKTEPEEWTGISS